MYIGICLLQLFYIWISFIFIYIFALLTYVNVIKYGMYVYMDGWMN